MNAYAYRIVIGAGLALLVGAAGAQTGGNMPNAPADKNATQSTQPAQTGIDSPSPTERYHATKRLADNPQAAPSRQPAVANSAGASDTQASEKTGLDSRSPTERFHAKRRMVANAPTEAGQQSTDKMAGEANAQANKAGPTVHAQKQAKANRHVAKNTKGTGRPDQVAAQGDKAYRQALRECVKEQDQGQRETCLDNAIAQFGRNT